MSSQHISQVNPLEKKGYKDHLSVFIENKTVGTKNRKTMQI